MSVTCKDISQKLNELAPTSLAESWDNVGFLIGDEKATVKKVLVALDATYAVVQEAIDKKVDMIITHHPMIMSGLKQVNKSTIAGQKVMGLIENRISLYSAHTNLDGAKEGLSTLLGHQLAIKNSRILSPITEECGTGQIGELEPMTLDELCQYVKDKLQLNSVRFVGDPRRVVQNIAVSPGSSMDFAPLALAAGAEVFITGDVKYHDAQEYREMGLALIDAGHYGTEHIVVKIFRDLIKKWFHDIEVIIADQDTDPFLIV